MKPAPNNRGGFHRFNKEVGYDKRYRFSTDKNFSDSADLSWQRNTFWQSLFNRPGAGQL
jgi:hypothetical protein